MARVDYIDLDGANVRREVGGVCFMPLFPFLGSKYKLTTEPDTGWSDEGCMPVYGSKIFTFDKQLIATAVVGVAVLFVLLKGGK